jgi:hypothetical protein
MYKIRENFELYRKLNKLESKIEKLKRKYWKLTCSRLKLFGSHNWKKACVNHQTARKILSCKKVSFNTMVNTNRKISELRSPKIRKTYASIRGVEL